MHYIIIGPFYFLLPTAGHVFVQVHRLCNDPNEAVQDASRTNSSWMARLGSSTFLFEIPPGSSFRRHPIHYRRCYSSICGSCRPLMVICKGVMGRLGFLSNWCFSSISAAWFKAASSIVTNSPIVYPGSLSQTRSPASEHLAMIILNIQIT